jgi:hypothetical protein
MVAFVLHLRRMLLPGNAAAAASAGDGESPAQGSYYVYGF